MSIFVHQKTYDDTPRAGYLFTVMNNDLFKVLNVVVA